MEYIRIPAVTEKLKSAESRFCPVWISAPIGYGKTSAVMNYYASKSILHISGESGSLDQMPKISKIRQSIVFIDDVSFLADENSKQYVISLFNEKRFQLILAGRCKFPKWLEEAALFQDFVFISEQEFRMGESQITELFEKHEVFLEKEKMDMLLTWIQQGYPLAVWLYLKHIQNGDNVSPALVQTVWEDILRFWDRNIFESYDSELWNLTLALAEYPEFSEDFAIFVTGNSAVREWVSYLQKTGQCIIQKGDSVWKFRPEAKKFFCWKRKKVYSEEKQKENYYRAACWYELHDRICEALEYYSLAGAEEQIKEILIKNALKHPGTGHYYDTRKYYEALSEQAILENPVLISGMCLLCSLMMNPKKSELWYQKLKEYSVNPKNPKPQRKDAKNRLAYLDIALPHRAGKGIIKIFQNTFQLIKAGELHLQEFSATSNLPGIMNGGLDFSQWSKNDNAIAKFLGHPLEVILGKHGKGLVDIALSESYFEKGIANPYEIVTRLNNGIADASNGGKMEIIFTATALLVKQHLLQGQHPTAKRRLDMFRQKVAEEQANQLIPNFEAFCTWFALYTGDKKAIRNYLESAPDEKKSFYVLDRYRYMIKIRCLIAGNQLAEALDLACFLTGYFTNYKRTYMAIENEILKSVILYRMENESWQSVFTEALKKAEEFHFVRVFSLEGAAVLPLLTHLKQNQVSKKFLKEITDEVKKMALYYPDYLNYVSKPDIYFTDRETQVLGLLCQGLSMQEICKECGISYDGLKKHNRNIYQKLGAKNRTEAERKAMQLGIVHRKGGES